MPALRPSMSCPTQTWRQSELFHSIPVCLMIAFSLQCIGEVMGKHEVAKGSYSIEGMAEGMQSGFTVTITGPANEKEFSQVDAVSGKFAFTASDAGAHKVCFVNNGPVSSA